MGNKPCKMKDGGLWTSNTERHQELETRREWQHLLAPGKEASSNMLYKHTSLKRRPFPSFPPKMVQVRSGAAISGLPIPGKGRQRQSLRKHSTGKKSQTTEAGKNRPMQL